MKRLFVVEVEDKETISSSQISLEELTWRILNGYKATILDHFEM